MTSSRAFAHARSFALLFLLSAAGCAAGADAGDSAGAPLIPRDVLFRRPARTQVRLSPDGAHLTWLAPHNGVPNIWIAATDDLENARPLTESNGRGVISYEFARGSERMLYREDRSGDGSSHIYAVDVATGAEVDLTPLEDVRAALAALSTARPNEVAVIVNTPDRGSDEVWRIDVRTGAHTVTFQNEASLEDLVFDHMLTPRIGFRDNDDGSITAVRVTGGELDGELFSIPIEAVRTTSVLGFDHTNQYAYLLGQRGSDKSRVTRLQIDSGAETTIAEGAKADIHSVLMSPVHGRPDAYSTYYFREEWVPISGSIGNDLVFLSEQLGRDYSVIDRTADDAYWLLFASDATDPGVYYLYDRKAGTIRELFSGSTRAGDLRSREDSPDGAHGARWPAIGRQWAISEGITPADRVAVYGHSFGGFAALAGLAFSPDVFRCGTAYAGIANLFSQIETFAVSGDSPYGFYRQTIGDPETEEGRARLRAQSPLFSAGRITKPLLIAHGANDRTVKQTEPDQIVGEMAANGQAVTYLVFPDEGHNFSGPESQEAFRAVSEAFLAQCLGGRTEPFGRALEGSGMTVPSGANHVPGLAKALPVPGPSGLP